MSLAILYLKRVLFLYEKRTNKKDIFQVKNKRAFLFSMQKDTNWATQLQYNYKNLAEMEQKIRQRKLESNGF